MRLACFTAAFLIGFGHAAIAGASGSSEAIAACDRAAASPLDKSRPAGLAGIPTERIDFVAAIQVCEAAIKADPGDDRMVMQLGRAHFAAADFDAARMKFDKANRMGNALAAVELADFFKNGRAGLPVDDVAAMHLLKKAAATGLAIAQMRLGYYHCYGRGGLAVDEREAVRLYRLAADQGFAPAQNNLGFLYQKGRGGLPRDDVQAAHYYQLAANQGSGLARSNLAVLYKDGRGGLAKDDAAALLLF
jgi:TPR repeat protein